MGIGVSFYPDWGCHVNHSFNQFSLFEIRHGQVTTLKFIPRQAIATL
jgi:hypothetical protein